MMNKKILVFPCGSEIALEIHRSLAYAKEVSLWGASTRNDHGSFIYENYIEGIPHVSDPSFVEAITRCVREEQVDYLFPAYDPVIFKLARAKHDGEFPCGLLTSPWAASQVCLSKKRTHDLFRDLVPMPRHYASPGQVECYPVWLKPEYGSGSKGACRANTLEDVRFHLEKDPSLAIFEYLPGKEYTVDCFTDRHRKLVFVGGRERERISDGISIRTYPVADPQFQRMAQVINSTLPLRGAWFFQVKADDAGECKLMEIGPRISGSMGLYRNLGVNFALMSIYDAEGHDVAPLVNAYDLIYDRALYGRYRQTGLAYQAVYTDLDDCLIVHGKLNMMLLTFLYQCVARRIRIVLLTRHAGDPRATLSRYRLENLFDEVIHLTDRAQRKSDVVPADALFIDDSFGERQDVAQRLGIPVFSPDMVESLVAAH